MKTNTQNIYLFKALEAYPYELEKAVEALNYALSYDPENTRALCLMAKVYGEQLGEYETAKEYFELALASNIEDAKIYPDYINTLLQNDDYAEAQKLIDYAMTVKGVDRGGIALLQGQLYETILEFEKAETAMKEALKLGLNNGFISYVEDELNRVTKKRERHNREKAKDTPTSTAVEASKSSWMNRLNSLL